MLNIKYDIVGSFLRPEPIKKARAEYAQGKITLEELRKVEDAAIADLVSKEVAHGLKIVTDGEFRRRWWHLDWLKEFDGFTTEHLDKERNGVVNHIELGYVCGKIRYDASHPMLRCRPMTSCAARLQSTRVSLPRSASPAPI